MSLTLLHQKHKWQKKLDDNTYTISIIMERSHVERIADIARRIDGPAVLADGSGEPVVVVPLSRYEAMLGKVETQSLTPMERSATINRDIAQGVSGVNVFHSKPDTGGVGEATEESPYYMEPLE